MRLLVPTMDAVIVDFDEAGRVRFEHEADWTRPTVQERRAIIHAARDQMDHLQELLDVLESAS